MIIGYIVQNVLGFILPVLLLLLQRTKHSEAQTAVKKRYIHLLIHGLISFWDCAFFLAFSIQIASIVVLARTNFGINANGMGDSTVRISWAVSLLTMLPLMYIVFIPSLVLENRRDNAKKTASNCHTVESKQREHLRTLLFILCWVFSF